MRKFLISSALAGSLVLSGCATMGTSPSGGGLTPEQIAQIQQTATTLCAFLPTFQTVQDIVVAGAYPPGIPIAQLANLVGNSICAAVTARSVRLGSTLPKVNGVVVQGSFVGRQ